MSIGAPPSCQVLYAIFPPSGSSRPLPFPSCRCQGEVSNPFFPTVSELPLHEDNPKLRYFCPDELSLRSRVLVLKLPASLFSSTEPAFLTSVDNVPCALYVLPFLFPWSQYMICLTLFFVQMLVSPSGTMGCRAPPPSLAQLRVLLPPR